GFPIFPSLVKFQEPGTTEFTCPNLVGPNSVDRKNKQSTQPQQAKPPGGCSDKFLPAGQTDGRHLRPKGVRMDDPRESGSTDRRESVWKTEMSPPTSLRGAFHLVTEGFYGDSGYPDDRHYPTPPGPATSSCHQSQQKWLPR